MGGFTDIISDSLAEAMWLNCSFQFDFTSNMLPVYRDGISPGGGDSGGPAVLNINTNPLLVGVASFGTCGGDSPSVYTNVGAFVNFINDGLASSPDIVVTGQTDLWNSVFMLRNIDVMNGGTLTIDNSRVSFAEGAKIHLHSGSTLILDEATLTSDCGTWKGIVNDGGEIRVLSQKTSSISNAEIGIEMLKDSELEVVIVQGGSVANPVLQFQDCVTNGIRGIDIEKLILREADFDNCEQGIILTFPDGNTSEDGNVLIDNCVFTNISEDLKIVSAGGFSNVLVQNNSFSGLIGVNMNGDNAYTIQYNQFSSSNVWSSFLHSTGVASNNLQQFNTIDYQSYGLVAYEDNSAFSFIGNCFTGSGFADVIVNGNLEDQGSELLATANCFTDNNNPDIASYDTSPFVYWEPDPNGTIQFNNCVYSSTNTPNGYVIMQESDNGEITNCNFAGGNNNNNNSTNFCTVNNNPTDINNEILNINTLISNINSVQFSSQEARDSELVALNRCLIKLHNQLASYYVVNNLINDAVGVYSNHPLFDMQIKGYFILVNEDQYVNARNYLNNLSASTIEQTEFVQSSIMYLDALEQGASYVLSQTDENFLYQAALKTYPLAGYSRSIWMHFKGEDIRMNVTLPTGHSAPRSKKDNKSEVSSQVSPNPTDIELIIKVDGLRDKTFSFDILDITGKLINRMTNLKETYRLNTISYSTGMYFCRVFDDQGKLINVHKVYIQ